MVDLVRRVLLGAGAAWLAMPTLARADTARDLYPLWEVRHGDARVFLSGDCGAIADPWPSARIEEALRESAVFWRETPASGGDKTAAFLAQGVDRAHPLSMRLSSRERDRVTAAATAVGTTYAFLEPLKPWLAAVALDQFHTQRLGSAPAKDPEATLTDLAKAGGKPIRSEFPDTGAIVAFAVGLSIQAQVQYLLLQVDDIEAGPDEWLRRSKAWASGDLRIETREARRIARAYPAFLAEFVAARNSRWPGRFRAMLDGGGTTFVLVGAGHLVGPENVLEQLAAAGLTARRLIPVERPG